MLFVCDANVSWLAILLAQRFCELIVFPREGRDKHAIQYFYIQHNATVISLLNYN